MVWAGTNCFTVAYCHDIHADPILRVQDIRVTPAVVGSMRGIMPTIWGYLENVDKALARSPHIQVRTILPGGIVIRVRAEIGAQTLITRGTESVDLSGLLEGEFVEVSYRHGSEGRLDAETISVRPAQTVVGQGGQGRVSL